MRDRLRKHLQTSSNRRGVLAIVGGTALGQLIIVVSAPVLSRLYDPAAFGLLATFTAIVSIGSILAAGRLEMAVPVANSDVEARQIVRAGLALCLVTSAIGGALLLPLSDSIADALRTPSLADWLWLAPWTCGLGASFVVLNQWAVREAQFSAIARRNTLRSLSMSLVQVGAGLLRLNPGGVVLGFAAGYVVGTASMFGRKSGFGPTDAFRGLRDLGPVLRRFRGFSTKLTISGLLNVAGTQAPILLFAAAYSVTAVGWLGLTQRVLALPVGLVGNAVAQVYVSALAKSVRDGAELHSLFRRVSIRLAWLAALGTVPLLLAGPQVFEVAFGPEWGPAGDYARLLSIGIAAQFVSVPLSQTLIIVGRTTLQLSWDVGRFVLVTGSVGLCIALEIPAATTVLVLGSSMAVTYTAQWWISHRVVQGLNRASAPD